jgi:DNA-binding IclR family transcriptional regulator
MSSNEFVRSQRRDETKELSLALKVHRNTMYKYLRGLVDKKWLEPGGKTHTRQPTILGQIQQH